MVGHWTTDCKLAVTPQRHIVRIRLSVIDWVRQFASPTPPWLHATAMMWQANADIVYIFTMAQRLVYAEFKSRTTTRTSSPQMKTDLRVSFDKRSWPHWDYGVWGDQNPRGEQVTCELILLSWCSPRLESLESLLCVRTWSIRNLRWVPPHGSTARSARLHPSCPVGIVYRYTWRAYEVLTRSGLAHGWLVGVPCVFSSTQWRNAYLLFAKCKARYMCSWQPGMLFRSLWSDSEQRHVRRKDW